MPGSDPVSALLALPVVPDWIALWPWAEGVVILFGFAWGAMLGSFLNVVVHRLPLGESVVYERSRCPRCRTPILARDNLPVVGWLLLRGRCRTCAVGISPEYPLVEVTCGLLVAGLAGAELAGGGRWLLHGAAGFPVGVDRLLRGDWQLLLTCCLHVAAVLMVFAWALLDRAGWRCPSTSLILPLGLAVLLVGLAPPAAPPGVLLDGAGWPADPRLQRITASLSGAAAGWLLGRGSTAASVRLGLPLLGSVLGWQALLVVTVVTGLAAGISRLVVLSPSQRGDYGIGLAVSGAFALACQTLVLATWQAFGAALGKPPL
jgi:leader peptidase (prepilin peptidase)/N-methyltransferase